MGVDNCNSEAKMPPEAKYYFKQTEYDINSGREDDMKEKCKLEVKINNISSGNCKVKLIQYIDNTRKTVLSNEGETETASADSSSKSIKFNKFYIMDYYFEKEQYIDFIISGTVSGKVSTTLPSIMGARGQKIIRSIEGGEDATLEISGFAYKYKQNSTFYFDVEINGNLNLKGVSYLVKSLGNLNKPANNILYKSESLNAKTCNYLKFNTAKIPDIYLAPDLNLDNNNIEISIFDSFYNKNLGKYSGTLSNIVNKETIIDLGSGKSAKVKMESLKNYAFLDYIRGGTQINLAIGIDFTGSNGLPSKPNSLHYINTSTYNLYETAIYYCGNIVAYYDYDQLFPVFGFGGKFCNDNNVSHCYPINMNPNDPNIQGIDGILQAYRNILNQTKLYGPTFFHYIINHVISFVKEDVISENKMNYTILMILTDGIIDDMDDTIDSLVEASFLPISVIIVGIGDADFTNMNFLDADDQVLVDRNGRKADRDLVQFVPFKKFSNNGELLAKEVLSEIPRQVIEYYQHQKMPPREPIYNIN